nr:MAG TPA: hypothetical protein [Caudoviricetes sp.]
MALIFSSGKKAVAVGILLRLQRTSWRGVILWKRSRC